MNTNFRIQHLEHPEDEKILDMLRNFENYAEEGFLRLESADRVFVVTDSEAHQKIKQSQGQALPLGEIELDGSRFSEYTINSSFFKS